MDPTTPASDLPTGLEPCYRHPDERTGVHCTRCGRPICPNCMIPAPVGFQCPECVQTAREEFRQGPGKAVRATATWSVSVTKVLLALIIGVFVVEMVVGGGNLLTGPSGQSLFEIGALYPPAIAIDGEYWRLLSPMFLHAGLIHIAFNSYVLWVFGQQVESTFGSARMVAIFLVTGFLASVASYVFGPINVVGVGASGAIFGLAGAFIAYTYRRRSSFSSNAQLQQALFFVLINVVLGFVIQGIDWRAHLGGLVAGIAAGWVADPGRPRQTRTLVTVLGFAVLIALGVIATMVRSEQLRELALSVI
ncbi:MAG: rhomboid family intramembrane serine protease [Actinomycetota bacterium]